MNLTIEEIDVFRGESLVLRHVSFEARSGEVVALLGRNGAGKTTALRSIMGLSPPASGRIKLGGTAVSGLPPHQIARMGIAYLPETRGILPSFKVGEVLRLASGRRPGPWTVSRVFQLFPRLAERQEHRGDELSGGEQQMLGLATALLLNPSVLLLDEPTHGLAPRIVSDLRDRIANIVTEGLTVVFVEQNLRFASALADRAILLGKGRVRWSGPMQELEADPEAQGTWLGV